MIRLAAPEFTRTEVEALEGVLTSGQLVQGKWVEAFESAVARELDASHGVAVSSGTAALHLALLTLGVGTGDAVVVPAFSFVATANAVELCGARPTFVDVDPSTFNMDPAALDSLLRQLKTAGKLPKVIMPVHAFGQMADMASIASIADSYGVPILEDAACALGSKLGGKPPGSWGGDACLSFHPRKVVTTGEGGMFVVNDEQRAARVRSLRNHGQDPARSPMDCFIPGFNYRMSDLEGALGYTQMQKLPRILEERRMKAARYGELLSGTAIQPPSVLEQAFHSYQSYVCLLPAAVAAGRDALIRRLEEAGVEAGVGTWHIPLATFYRECYGHQRGDFPGTDTAFDRAVSIPMHGSLSDSDQELVVKRLTEALTGL